MIAQVKPKQFMTDLTGLNPNVFKYAVRIQPTNMSLLYDAVKANSPQERAKLELQKSRLELDKQRLEFSKQALKEKARLSKLKKAEDAIKYSQTYSKAKAGSFDLYAEDNPLYTNSGFSDYITAINSSKDGLTNASQTDPNFSVNDVQAWKNNFFNLRTSKKGKQYESITREYMKFLDNQKEDNKDKNGMLIINNLIGDLDKLEVGTEESEAKIEELYNVLTKVNASNYNNTHANKHYTEFLNNLRNGSVDIRGRQVTTEGYDYLLKEGIKTDARLADNYALFLSDKNLLTYYQNNVAPQKEILDTTYYKTGELSPEAKKHIFNYLESVSSSYSPQEVIAGVRNSQQRLEDVSNQQVKAAQEKSKVKGSTTSKPTKAQDILGGGFKLSDNLNNAIIKLSDEGYSNQQITKAYESLLENLAPDLSYGTIMDMFKTELGQPTTSTQSSTLSNQEVIKNVLNTVKNK